MEIFPEAVSANASGYLDFNIHSINVALVNAVKELKLEKDKELAALNSTIEQLLIRIKKLENN